jgi:Recombination endonuclease VII
MLDKEKHRKRARVWYWNNRDKALANMKKYRDAHPGLGTRSSQKWRLENPQKARTYQAGYRKTHREKNRIYCRGWARINRAGLRDKQLAFQGGVCAICKTSNPGKQGWHRDHCYATKKWRGVLCANCNWGLGHFKENTHSLRAAVQYIRRKWK